MSTIRPAPVSPGRPAEDLPPLMRMMHPSSGRENFNNVAPAPPVPIGTPYSPQYRPQINMQAQQAIAMSGLQFPGRYQNAYANPYPNAYPMAPSFGAMAPYGYGYGQNNPFAYYYPYQRKETS